MNDSTQQSWWQRLSGGLKRTSSQLGTAIKGLVSKRKLDASTLEELENELIRADFGIEVADRTIEALRQGRTDAEAPIAVRTLEPAGGESSNRWYRLVTVGASGHEVRQLFERRLAAEAPAGEVLR